MCVVVPLGSLDGRQVDERLAAAVDGREQLDRVGRGVGEGVRAGEPGRRRVDERAVRVDHHGATVGSGGVGDDRARGAVVVEHVALDGRLPCR
jgi:hypothetical protein